MKRFPRFYLSSGAPTEVVYAIDERMKIIFGVADPAVQSGMHEIVGLGTKGIITYANVLSATHRKLCDASFGVCVIIAN